MPIQIGGNPYQYRESNSFLSGYGNLAKLATRPYDEDEVWRQMSASRPGTMKGGLSNAHLYEMAYQPEKYSVIAPVRNLSTPVLGGGRAGRNLTGNFTLDLIDWNSNLQQLTGGSISRDPAAFGNAPWPPTGGTPIDPVMDWFGPRDISPFENMPRRLMDYAFAPFDVLAARITGGSPSEQSAPGTPMYPFQQDPNYWTWLRESSPEARAQMARFVADSRADRARNQPLYEMLVNQFNLDWGSIDARSSGNARIDFVAKLWLQQTPVDVKRRLLMAAGMSGPEAAAALTEEENRRLLRESPGIGILGAAMVPFIGTQLGEAVDPITQETERAWLALTAEERSKLLSDAGIAMGASDFATFFMVMPSISAAAKVMKSAQAVESIALNWTSNTAAAAAIGQAVSGGTRLAGMSLTAANRVMATGLGVMTASWAMQSYAPFDSEWAQLGRQLDASRTISSSPFAGVLNEIGFFSGFYGLETAVPWIVRTGRAGANILTRGGTAGQADLLFHQFYGGSSMGRLFASLGISHQVQGAALSTEFTSGILNLRRERLLASGEAIIRGAPTGIEDIDMLPTIKERLERWEWYVAQGDKALMADAAVWADTVNARAAGGNAKKMADAIDNDVTRWAQRRYGAFRMPSKVTEIRAQALARLRAIAPGINEAALDRAIGDNAEAWRSVWRRSHQILFHKRHVELMDVAEQAGENADDFALFSMRTLFRDEVEDYARTLVDSTDPAAQIALMRELRENKDTIGQWWADGRFRTPEDLADLLLGAMPVLPFRRQIGGTGSVLDDFQSMLDGEGIWTVGEKPVGKIVAPPDRWVRIEDVTPENMPGLPKVLFTPDELQRLGYRRPYRNERMRGPEFARRDPVWAVEEYGGSVWIREMPGDVAPPAPPPVAAAPTGPHMRGEGNTRWLADSGSWGDLTPDPDDLAPVYRTHENWDESYGGGWYPEDGDLLEVRAGSDAPTHWESYGIEWGIPPSRMDDIQAKFDYFSEPPVPPGVERAGIVAELYNDISGIGVVAIRPKHKVTGESWLGYDATFPKGGIEPGEEPFRAAIREFVEETGLEPEAYTLEYIGDFPNPSGSLTRYYRAKVIRGHPKYATHGDETGNAIHIANPYELEPYLTQHGVLNDRDIEALHGWGRLIGIYREVDDLSRPKWVSGRNGDPNAGLGVGANWPVLRDSWGGKWIFKARNGYPQTSFSPGRQLAGPTATKMFQFLGLRTAVEQPFRWNVTDPGAPVGRLNGTIQRFLDIDSPVSLEPDQLTFYAEMHRHGGPDVIGELQRHHLVDWFTSQHDSNSDAFSVLADGSVAGIDKGQAWLFFGKDHELAAFNDPLGFWRYGKDRGGGNGGFDNPQAADYHLGQYLHDWHERGGFLDRGAVEETLQKIEALDDATMRAWLLPLAEGRVASGYMIDVDEFIDAMIARRDVLRDRVNAAYELLGQMPIARPGSVQSWKPYVNGTFKLPDNPVPINAQPKTTTFRPGYVEPPPVDWSGDRGIGLLVEEPDGQVWAMAHSDGSQTLPWQIRPAGATASPTADEIGEIAENYLGLSVRIEEVISDIPENGIMIRWYRATRTGGGPGYAALGPSQRILMGPPDLVRANPATAEMTWGWHAWNALDAQRNAPSGGGAGAPPPVGPVPAFLDEADAALDYLSYTVLPDGNVFRSPWIDYPIPHADQVAMGNRGFIAAKFDQVFQGWRTNRILEFQKGVLWRRLDSLSPEFGAVKVSMFHEGLIDLARKHHLAGVQSLGLSGKWMGDLPLTVAVRNDVQDLAESIFGRGPYLTREGTVRDIDWHREIATAYQTALSLNLTAGLTSKLKTMLPGGVSYISDVAYPAFRFALSPGFKAGEWAEGPILNGLRGVNPFGADEMQRAIWQRNGLPDSGGDFLEEALVEPMLAGAGRSRAEALRSGLLSAALPPGATREVRRRMRGEPPIPFPGEELAPPASLTERLFPSLERGPRPYPDEPLHNVQSLMPHTLDENGIPIYDPARMAELDNARIEEGLGQDTADVIQGFDDSGADGLDQLALGVGWINRYWGDDAIERLAANVPIIHAASPSASRGLDRLEQALREGRRPAYGIGNREDVELVGELTGAGEVTLAPPSDARSSTSVSESILGMADAPYSGPGFWRSPDTGIAFVFKNDRVLPKSVITNGDRIGWFRSGPRSVVEKHLLSANGTHRLLAGKIRINLLRHVRDRIDGLQNSDDSIVRAIANGFDDRDPIEVATPGGADWSDIDAIMLPDAYVPQWEALVRQYGDQVPELRTIDILPVNNSQGRRDVTVAWKYAMERAGLADKIDAVFEPSMLTTGDIERILPNDVITPLTAPRAWSSLTYRASDYGLMLDHELSLEDFIRRAMDKDTASAREAWADSTALTAQTGGYASTGDSFRHQLELADEAARNAEAHRSVLADLLAEVEAFRATAKFASREEANLAIRNGSQEEINAAGDWLVAFSDLENRVRAAVPSLAMQGRNMTSGPFSRAVLRDPAAQVVRAFDLPPRDPVGHSNELTPTQQAAGARAINGAFEELRAGVPQNGRFIMPQARSGRGPFVGVRQQMMADTIAGPEFLQALKDAATAKTGVDQPFPTVKVWARGTREAVEEFDKPGGEIVITVSYPGTAFPLRLDEIADIWKRHGLPGMQSAVVEQPMLSDVLFRQSDMLWDPAGGMNGSIRVARHGTHATGHRSLQGEFSWNPMTEQWEFVAGTANEIVERPVRFLYAFDPEGARMARNLSDDVELKFDAVLRTRNAADLPRRASVPDGDEWIWYDRDGDWSWAMGIKRHDSYLDVDLQTERALSLSDAEQGIRQVIDEANGLNVRLKIDTTRARNALARMHARHELPESIVPVLNGNVVTREELERWAPRPAVPQQPDSLAAVAGSAESVREGFVEVARREGGKGGRWAKAWEAFWNPVPYKQKQQDRLIRALAKEWFPETLRARAPKVAEFYARDLRVPDYDLVDFILEDRELYWKWINSGTDEDFARLVAHADKYTGKAASPEYRAAIDQLYESPDWPIVTEMMRWTARAARDEAFGVHFFNPYRSTFERSINHPLLGVYPASWAYKVAKEWFRFLYQNRTFGFSLGMQPARFIAQMQQAQGEAFAQDGENLGEWLRNGPMGSTIFIFNLIMPGDWSALPFPLSRSIRDLLRGQVDPTVHFRNNLVAMGLGRDVRLSWEAANEWYNLATGQVPPRRSTEQPIPPDALRR